MLTLQEVAQDFALNWPLYLAMPVIACLIGYVTKILAIKMMFQPLEFRGIKPFLGWQGIVPKKAGEMAAIMHDTLTARLIKPAEIVGRLDPQRAAQLLEPELIQVVEQIVHEVMGQTKPGLWEALPQAAKNKLMLSIRQKLPDTLAAVLRDVQNNLDDVFDLKAMMVKHLSNDKALLNRIFLQAGRGEFRFIRLSGIYFGFAIGCIQAVTWAFTQSPWIMPLFGGFVGWFSDWMALKMVFRPMRERVYLGVFRWQGLFLRRQQEVAVEYGSLLAENVLTVRNLITHALNGPLVDQLMQLVERHVSALVDEQAGIAKPLVVYSVGGLEYRRIKQDVSARLMTQLPYAMLAIEGYAEKEMDIRQTLVEKLKLMTPEEFEGVLRPVFQQDEWKLIMVGAVLGFLVGELQVHLMLSV